MSQITFVSIPPVMSQQLFADMVGVTKDTVRGWLQADTIPSAKIGKQLFVNVSKIQFDLQSGKDIFTRGDYDD